MTVTLFIGMLTFGSAVSALFTEAVKKALGDRTYSANMIALINAIVIGCGGTAIAYILMGIPFTLNNNICLALMSMCVWMGSMVGYDKLIQLVKQLG